MADSEAKPPVGEPRIRIDASEKPSKSLSPSQAKSKSPEKAKSESERNGIQNSVKDSSSKDAPEPNGTCSPHQPRDEEKKPLQGSSIPAEKDLNGWGQRRPTNGNPKAQTEDVEKATEDGQKDNMSD